MRRMGWVELALVGGLLAAGGAPAAERPAGTVVAVEGQVHRQPAGEARWVPVAGRQLLRYGDLVTSLGDGRALLQLGEGVVFVLGPDSQFTLPPPRTGLRDLLIQLRVGVFRLLAAPRARRGALRVQTPTAVAAVRGTELVGEADDRQAGIAVLRGEVEVAGHAAGPTVLVRAGEGTDVAAGQDPTPPAPWGAARLERLRGLTTLR